jgi:hypothetical protein
LKKRKKIKILDFGLRKIFSESEIKFPSLTFWNEKERREEKRKR